MNILSPSILAADFVNLERDIRCADEAGAMYIHLDIMDGAFVPNISFGMPVIKAISGITDKTLDVHLMIDEPIRYIDDLRAAGADILCVHAEACKHLDRTIEAINESGAKAAVALNPATPISMIEYVLPKVSMVLLMSVNPGFGGQSFIPYTIDKIKALRKILDEKGLNDVDIEVDGGVTLDNVEEVLAAGANIIVAGSAVFKGDTSDNVKKFMEKLS